jgi:N-methylhydantoinase B/oxoprolinase/acetone carboxylase alpha subunit
MTSIDTSTTVDAFTAEVLRSAVVAIPREMKTNLMRTAYSSTIMEKMVDPAAFLELKP